MLMLNDLDRYRIAMDVIRHVPGLEQKHGGLSEHFSDERARLRAFAYANGEDSPDVAGWPFAMRRPTAEKPRSSQTAELDV